jgi:hypothetical protein
MGHDFFANRYWVARLWYLIPLAQQSVGGKSSRSFDEVGLLARDWAAAAGMRRFSSLTGQETLAPFKRFYQPSFLGIPVVWSQRDANRTRNLIFERISRIACQNDGPPVVASMIALGQVPSLRRSTSYYHARREQAV